MVREHPMQSSREPAIEPKSQRISKKTEIAVQAGVIASILLSLGVWMHTRVNCLELEAARRDERDKYILQKLESISDDMKEHLNQPYTSTIGTGKRSP
jgi:hypothetical protein